MKTITCTNEHVRYLGRVYSENNEAFLAWSATGVEFIFTGKSLSFTVLSSDLCENENKAPHIVCFVDDERTLDFLCNKNDMTLTVLDLPEVVTKKIRIVKASEAVESVCALSCLTVDDEASVVPTSAKPFLMEVIGDSITCGYGVNGTLKDTFTTGLEDATKAYAYLCSKSLDADLNIVAMSGHGIISGYTEGDINTEQLVMPYYDTYGKSFDVFYNGLNPGDIKWEFKRRPDLIVINLGTNDTSWCKEDDARRNMYKEEYINTLKTLRALNPDAKILCILGIMYQTLYSFIEKAVEEYKEETKDTKVSCCFFELQSESDGIAVDYHPSAITQKKAGQTLAALIRDQYQLKGEKK